MLFCSVKLIFITVARFQLGMENLCAYDSSLTEVYRDNDRGLFWTELWTTRRSIAFSVELKARGTLVT